MTDQTNHSRAAITGIGIVSPIGIGIDAFTESLFAGRSGVTRFHLFEGSEVPGHIGAEVRDFTPKTAKDYIRQRKSIKVMCREIQLGVAAATLALDDAGLGEGQTAVAPERLGIDFGANLMLSPPEVLAAAATACAIPAEADQVKFVRDQWGEKGLRAMEPLWLLQFLPNMPACHIGIYADARGPNNSLTMAEVSGNMALSEALRILQRRHADVMITGTTGTTMHAVKSMHAVMWDKLADAYQGDPTQASRPFDADRTGQVVSEGSAVLILEDEAHAQARGAKLYGYVLGAGSGCVAKSPGHGDFRAAFTLAMKNAFHDAGLTPADIGHINAHAMGDPEVDADEAAAIHDVFGELGDKVPVTAFKSYWGNPGSSCGTLEAAASLVGLQKGVVLPTLNYKTPDPKCRLNVVHGSPLPVTNKVFLKLSVTRQGQAAAAILSGV